MDNLNFFPQIDFNYWYERNIENSNSSIRFVSMITRINNIYEKDNNFNQAYFCGNQNEISRLKELSYNELEDEIIRLIRSKENEAEFTDIEILKIYDLIQIWGGLTGGSNPYKITNNNSIRLEFNKWIKYYRELINLSIKQDNNAYNFVLQRKIPNLNMSFGSKHIFFWSRKELEKEKSSLIVIDNKISGVFGYKKAINADYNLILGFVHEKSIEKNLMSYQIEKALFTFHKFYFNNDNDKFIQKDSNSKDYDVALRLKQVLDIDNLEKNQFKVQTKSKGKKIKISKLDYLNLKGVFFISAEYYNKSKNKALINTKSSINYKGRLYYEYIGDNEQLEILS